jgi:hypothetical protein
MMRKLKLTLRGVKQPGKAVKMRWAKALLTQATTQTRRR